MACLFCQKSWSDHNKEEYSICADWVQNNLSIMATKLSKIWMITNGE